MPLIRPIVQPKVNVRRIYNRLKLGQRTDGRGFSEFRDYGVAFGLQPGTCQALVGRTRCDARVLCSIITPEEDNPEEGTFHVRLRFASDNILDSTWAGADEMESILEACFQDAGCMDMETLLIREGSMAWALTVEITVLDEGDGAVLDCASTAAIGAMTDFLLPATKTTGASVAILDPEAKTGSPLILQCLPIMTTWVFFNSGLYVLADPRVLEMAIGQGRILVGCTATEVTYLEQSGPLPADPEMGPLKEVLHRATKRGAQIVDHLKAVHGVHNAARAMKYPTPYGYAVAPLLPAAEWRRVRAGQVALLGSNLGCFYFFGNLYHLYRNIFNSIRRRSDPDFISIIPFLGYNKY
jgi:exosome complex RNA-binding protein Rrp42 (RNase PH superfamily)